MPKTIASPYCSPNRLHDRRFFYKYVTADVAKIILSTRKLRWSSPLLFNDPFDITQELRLDFDNEELGATLTEKVASLIEEGAPSTSAGEPAQAAILALSSQASPEVRKTMADELRMDNGIPKGAGGQSLDDLKEMWSCFVPTFRIFCVSESNDINAMWAHYADSHRGVVLEFEAVDEIDSAFLTARPVTYQDSPPLIADANEWVRCILKMEGASFKALHEQLLWLKTSDWSYEREWRIVSRARKGDNGLYQDYEFHPRELTGVYFGSRCPEHVVTDMRPLLSHGLEHVSAYQANQPAAGAKFTFSRLRE